MNNLNFNFNSIIELITTFNTEQKCIKYLEKVRWNGNVVSPFDPTSKVYKLKNNQYRCKNTDRDFNVKTNTLFEGTNIKLQKWFLGIYLITSHKKGMSSLQLSKDLNITQKSSWFMLHRIRNCYNIQTEQLTNEVEIDETFVGGKNKPNCQGGKDKSIVFGMVERGGKFIGKVVPNRQTKSLLPHIKENIKENSNVMTDELLSYQSLNNWYNHFSVNHRQKEYVNGIIHTNTLEGFWSIFKRGFVGIYHWMSPKHLI